MLLLYRSLLRLYPAAYRDEYGEEMMAVLCEVQTEIGRKSVFARVALRVREVGGLLRGALLEHVRSITGSYGYPMFSPRRFTMRSEFRFPKATVTLMTVILIAVIMTIEKAKAIQESVPSTNPLVGPIRPEHVTILPAFLIAVAGACLAGALGWAILFALRRSGVHRLSDVNPSSGQRPGGGLSI